MSSGFIDISPILIRNLLSLPHDISITNIEWRSDENNIRLYVIGEGVPEPGGQMLCTTRVVESHLTPINAKETKQ